MLHNLEVNFPEIFVDIEMNSLEDAYVNIAKAEEKLHNEQNQVDVSHDKSLDENEDFQRYLSIQSFPSFWRQT